MSPSPTELLQQALNFLNAEVSTFGFWAQEQAQTQVRGSKAETIQRMIERQCRNLRVEAASERRICVIGATGSGKSSLVNALLGEKVAISAGAGAAVTCVPTEYYYFVDCGSSINNITHTATNTNIPIATPVRNELLAQQHAAPTPPEGCDILCDAFECAQRKGGISAPCPKYHVTLKPLSRHETGVPLSRCCRVAVAP